MSQILNAYVTFDGTCTEAVNFYAEALGGTSEIHTFGEFGMPGPDGDRVMHAKIETPAGFVLMASDLGPGRSMTTGDNISLSLSGTDETALRGYWDNLSAGANITMPLEKQVWGDVFGYLVDKFGVGWMVNVVSTPEG